MFGEPPYGLDPAAALMELNCPQVPVAMHSHRFQERMPCPQVSIRMHLDRFEELPMPFVAEIETFLLEPLV